MPPGLQVTESSSSIASAAPSGFGQIMAFGTSTNSTAADLNTPIKVKDSTDFSTRFPGAPEITSESIKFIFLNYPGATVYYVNCRDSSITGAPQDKGHYVYGANAVSKKQTFKLSAVVCPEISSITLQADRTTAVAAFESLCQKLDWIHFLNSAAATDTKQEALDERALYTSLFGHTCFYYGFIKTTTDKTVPSSVGGAIVLLLRSLRESSFQPPAGALYPLAGVDSIISYVDDEIDYYDLRAKGINVIQFMPGIGWCVWGARTLAVDERYIQINTRASVSITSERIKFTLVTVLFSSSDPQGYIRREVVRRVSSVMEAIYTEGGLSGNTSQQAYRFEEVVTTVTPNLRKIEIRLYARFVDTLEDIVVGLINVDVVPNAIAAAAA